MDTEKLKEIIAVFEHSTLTAMELEADDMKLVLQKQSAAPAATSISLEADAAFIPASSSTAEKEKEEGEVVRSPLVGTFYAAANASADPFVEIGTKVKEGDILCIIEAMKVMNEIHAPCDGVIRKIGVKDGDMVQFDEALFWIGA